MPAFRRPDEAAPAPKATRGKLQTHTLSVVPCVMPRAAPVGLPYHRSTRSAGASAGGKGSFEPREDAPKSSRARARQRKVRKKEKEREKLGITTGRVKSTSSTRKLTEAGGKTVCCTAPSKLRTRPAVLGARRASAFG